MTEEQFLQIGRIVAQKRRLKRYKDSSLAIYKDAIEEVMGYIYPDKLRLIGALRCKLTYDQTLDYIKPI